MAYCKDPKNHKNAWWADPGGFEWFDYRLKKIVPKKFATMHCAECHNHWNTSNRELIAKLSTEPPKGYTR